MWRLCAIAWLGLCGCLPDRTTTCADDTVCPLGTSCVAPGRCAVTEQVTACQGLGEGAACRALGVDGVCAGGVCTKLGCGNGIAEPDEACDDGNLAFGDGCDGLCASTETCGNGYTDAARGEACDCGDDPNAPPPGCPGPNSEEPGALCRTDCTFAGCGDGVVAAPEDCEPTQTLAQGCEDLAFYGGALSCGDDCRLDASACSGRCGDQIVNGPEACDVAVPTSCGQLGFDLGRPACSTGCALDLSTCARLGFDRAATSATNNDRVWVAPTGEIFAWSTTRIQWTSPTGVGVFGTISPGGVDEVIQIDNLHGCAFGEAYALRSDGIDPPAPQLLGFDGASWTARAQLSGDYRHVRCVAPGVAIAAGADGRVARIDSVGAAAIDLPEPLNITGLAGTDDDLWAATQGGLWHRSGGVWTERLADVALASVAVDDRGAWAGATAGGVYGPDGAGWILSAVPGVPGAIDMLASTVAGMIARSAAGLLAFHDGNGWGALPSPGLAAFESIAAPDPGSAAPGLYAVAGGDVYRSTWALPQVGYASAGQRPLLARDGALWTTAGAQLRRNGVLIATASANLVKLWNAPDGAVIAMASNGDACRWDGALDVQTAAGPPGAGMALQEPWGASHQDFLVLRGTASVPPLPLSLRRYQGGVSTAVLGVSGLALDGVDASFIVVGGAGVVNVCDASTASTTCAPLGELGVTGNITAVLARATNEVYVGSDRGLVLRWDGSTWSSPDPTAPGSMAVPPSLTLGSIDALRWSRTHLLALTSDARVLQHDGEGWLPVFGLGNVGAVTAGPRGWVVRTDLDAVALRRVVSFVDP